MLLLLGWLIFFASPVSAQTNTFNQIAVSIDLDSPSQDGSLICQKDSSYSLCNSPQDPNFVGVISLEPLMVWETLDSAPTTPIVTQGDTLVRVSAENGTIQTGDPLTTSSLPGVAIKADSDGFVVGFALENFESNGNTQTGTITASINPQVFSPNTGIGPGRGDLTYEEIAQNFRLATTPTYLKYALALATSLASLLLAFAYFGRMAREGILSLGRNPLASRAIQIGIALNSFLAITILASGIIVSYFILNI